MRLGGFDGVDAMTRPHERASPPLMTSNTDRRKASKARPRRDRIVVAALELFARRPFNDVSTREIADSAGVSLRLMWYYFKSKEELRDAVDELVLDEIRELSDPAFRVRRADRFAAIVDAAATAGRGPVLTLYIRRMLIDEGPRGRDLLERILARTYTVLEAPGNPVTYSAQRRQHEIALIVLLLGPIMLKPLLDARYGVDVHGPSEREGRLAVFAPLIEAALGQPIETDSAAAPGPNRSREDHE